jgi:hypothetical protein
LKVSNFEKNGIKGQRIVNLQENQIIFFRWTCPWLLCRIEQRQARPSPLQVFTRTGTSICTCFASLWLSWYEYHDLIIKCRLRNRRLCSPNVLQCKKQRSVKVDTCYCVLFCQYVLLLGCSARHMKRKRSIHATNSKKVKVRSIQTDALWIRLHLQAKDKRTQFSANHCPPSVVKGAIVWK